MTVTSRDRAFLTLSQGLRAQLDGDPDGARRAFRPLTDHPRSLVRAFAQRLLANLDGEVKATQLYAPESQAEADRQIDFFDAVSRLDYLRQPVEVTGAVHRERAKPGTVLLDLGIGNGGPAVHVVRTCAPHIECVIGVDIDPDSLERAGAVVRGLGAQFVAVPTCFAELDWSAIRERIGGRPLHVNASFALHHLHLRDKQRVLDSVMALRPAVLTMSEPSSQHAQADLFSRFVHSYHHFSIVERLVLRSSLSPATAEQVVRFFCREVDDILRDSSQRYERHEDWLFWYAELLRRGFEPLDVGALSELGSDEVQLQTTMPGALNTVVEGTHMLTTFAFAA